MTKDKKSKPSKNNEVKAEDWMPFFEELQQESQRGGTLVGTAFLDEHLRQLLAAFMIKNKSINKELFEGINAPLSSFSARIKMAYSLGLISQDVYHDLNVIRGIRNEFAHALHGLSFENEWIIQECSKLIIPTQLGFKAEITSPVDRFLLTVALLSQWIKLWSFQAKRERRNAKTNITTGRLELKTNNNQ